MNVQPKTAWEILLVEKPTLELIRASYKEKMRAILDGSSSMTQTELNAAYNEVKTQEKLDAYRARFPFKDHTTVHVTMTARYGYNHARKAYSDSEDYYPGWAGPVRHGDRQAEAPRNPNGS